MLALAHKHKQYVTQWICGIIIQFYGVVVKYCSEFWGQYDFKCFWQHLFDKKYSTTVTI